MFNGFEQMLIEPSCVRPVERVHIRILLWFAGLNEVQPDAVFVRPFLDLAAEVSGHYHSEWLWVCHATHDALAAPG